MVRQLILIICMGFFYSMTAQAECLQAPCQLIKFKTIDCKFIEVNNRQEIDRLQQQQKRAGRRVDWEQYYSSVTGIRLTIKEQWRKEVPCIEKATLSKSWDHKTELISSDIYFYQTNNKDACFEFLSEKKTKFIFDTCCDTVPGHALCHLEEPILTDVPKHLLK